MPNKRLAAVFASTVVLSGLAIASAVTAPATAGPVTTLTGPAAVTPATVSPLPPSATTTLPYGTISSMAADNVHHQVFISMAGLGEIIVTNAAGTITHTLTGLTSPGELAVAPDGSAAYATTSGGATLTRIDTQTYAVTSVAMPANDCPRSLTVTGGSIWFSYRCDATPDTQGIAALNPADNTVSHDTAINYAGGTIRAAAGNATRLVLFGDGSRVYDVSTDPATPVTTGSPGSNCHDGALVNNGAQLVVACIQTYGHDVFNTADFTGADDLFVNGYQTSVAASPDGAFVALGASGFPVAAEIFYTGGGFPAAPASAISVPRGYDDIPDNGLLWDSAGTLFVADDNSTADTLKLLVFPNANHVVPAVTVKVPKWVRNRGTVAGTGTISPAPGVATTATLTRTTRAGTTALANVAVAADGTFSFTDAPGTTGPVTYTVAAAASGVRVAATGSGTTIEKVLPFDIKGTGYPAVVVGAPGEAIGSLTRAGQFHVLYSDASGVTGTGSAVYTQDTTGVPGTVEKNDQFGWSQASGDFNGDGYADLAVSSNREAVGSTVAAGTVAIFYGGPTGLKTTGVQLLQARYPSTGDYFGETLAAGDFNGDGRDDLAINSAGTNDVYVDMGSATGLSATTFSDWRQDTSGIPGTDHAGENFGQTLATGDINGDGYSDLAIGAPYDYDDYGYSTGSVTIIYGTSKGLTATGSQRLSKATTGVPGTAQTFAKDISDLFGWQIVLGDFNGDGKADLAVSAIGAPVTTSDKVKHEDAGTVTVLYSDGTKIGTTGAVEVTQATAGMPGNPGTNDQMGCTMDAGDSNGDGYDDLAIFSLDRYVTIVKGGPSGLSYSSAVAFTQSTSGVAGTDTVGDVWGDSLRFQQLKGATHASLVVGADGKHSGEGSLTVLYSTTSGLTGTGSAYFDQDSPGVSGTPEKGDNFGAMYTD